MEAWNLVSGLILSGLLCVLLCGWWLLFERDFVRLRRRGALWIRLRRQRHGREVPPWLRTLESMLFLVFGRSCSGMCFLVLLGVLFVTASAVGMHSFSLLPGLLFGAAATLFPVLLLYLRLTKMRKNGSREGELLAAEFLRQYRIAEQNIYRTLERMVEAGKKTRVTTRLLFRLLLDLQDTGNPLYIRNATDAFGAALDTNWGRMMAYNIYLAAAHGSDVSMAMEDILIQLRDARNLEEERKRMNSEAFRMTTFMVPVTYVLTVFMASVCLDIPAGTFLHNQFCTSGGLALLFLIALLFLLNQTVLSLVLNQKFDY